MRFTDETTRSVWTLGLSVVLLMLICSGTRADTYGFQAISDNSGASSAIAGQLTVEISPYGDTSDQVLFTFVNGISASYNGNIMQIFFDDRDGLGAVTGLEEPDALGVDFKQTVKNNRAFPEGKHLTPAFDVTDFVVFDGGKGKIGPGEYLGVVYSLADGVTFQDVIDAIQNGVSGPLRVGIHVGGIAPAVLRDDSDSFIMVHVPAPGAVLLGAWGIGTAGLYLRRRRDLANA